MFFYRRAQSEIGLDAVGITQRGISFRVLCGAGTPLWASRPEVPLTGLQVEVRADSDVVGLIGAVDIAAGYAQVQYTVIVESTASEGVILRMLDEAERHSPWLDNFMRPIDCHRQVRIVAAEDA